MGPFLHCHVVGGSPRSYCARIFFKGEGNLRKRDNDCLIKYPDFEGSQFERGENCSSNRFDFFFLVISGVTQKSGVQMGPLCPLAIKP
jgi:hypothetical protein